MFRVVCLTLLFALVSNAVDREVCQMPIDPGRCRGFFPHFAYVAELGRCEGFIYGGCGGNGNRFETREDCEQVCANRSPGLKPDRDPRCQLPIDPGNCMAYFPHYGFHERLQQCVRFIYGGCGGNANRFNSMQECRNVCERKF